MLSRDVRATGSQLPCPIWNGGISAGCVWLSIDQTGTGAVEADGVLAVTVEVAAERPVSRLTKEVREISRCGPQPVRNVHGAPAGTLDGKRVIAVTVPVSGQWNVSAHPEEELSLGGPKPVAVSQIDLPGVGPRNRNGVDPIPVPITEQRGVSGRPVPVTELPAVIL